MSRLACVLLVIAGLTSCIHKYTSLDVRELPVGDAVEPTDVTTPVRVHLADGSTVVYRSGVSVGTDSLRGAGQRYDVLTGAMSVVRSVPMDSVLGLEAFSIKPNSGSTVAVSALTTTAAIGAGAVLTGLALVAIFGSCPTVYTMAPEGEILEAELFSYSIAPLLEARDVDVIGTVVRSDGTVELEIRNEALETHRINYLGMLAVEHEADETVMPDARGAPVAVAELSTPPSVRDASGTDVSAIVARRDGAHFASAPRLLADVSVDRLYDHLDLALPPMPGADSVAVVLRMRNSLLNTVLFYDQMLASAGAQALDWLGSDLQQIGPAVALGEWYTSRMGMQVQVGDGASFRTVQRVPDAGPIAWKDVAVIVPVISPQDSVRIRLAFVVDEWRIDRIQIAARVRRPEVREVPVTQVIDAAGAVREDVRMHMAEPDEDYAESLPGQHFTARFAVGATTAPARTFLVAAQGYYTEWLRADWIRQARGPERFVPGDAALVTAIERWRDAKPSFEKRFYATRIPVR